MVQKDDSPCIYRYWNILHPNHVCRVIFFTNRVLLLQTEKMVDLVVYGTELYNGLQLEYDCYAQFNKYQKAPISKNC